MDKTKGVVTSLLLDKGTLSQPSFASVMLTDKDEHVYDFHAQGKAATQIIKSRIKKGGTVTVTHEGHKINSIEVH